MNRHTLSPLQLKALDHLLQGKTIAETARQLNVGRTTLHEWGRSHPAFIAAFQEARQRQQEAVLDRYHALATPSLQLLESIITDESQPQKVRLRAALAVLKSVETNGPAAPFTLEQRQQLYQALAPDTAEQIRTN